MSEKFKSQILEYASDYQIYVEPWRRWQERRLSARVDDWEPCTGNPTWDTSKEYRRCPDTVLIDGQSYVAPLSSAVDGDTVTDFMTLETFVFKISSQEHMKYLDDGRLFSNKPDAEIYQKAILEHAERFERM